MNKKMAFSVILGFLFILISNVALFAQGTNNEQRLVGSWTALHNPNLTISLNANGTMSMAGGNFDGFVPTHWAAAGDRIFLYIPNSNNRAIRTFNISSDGRTLIVVLRQLDGMTGNQELGTAYRRN